MSGIFVNYRRHFREAGDGSEPALVEALADRLRRHFGDTEVFLDVESIPVGERYPNQLRARLSDAEVLIAIIGPGWLAETRHRATWPAKDWVRWEIAEALRLPGTVVVPVLLGETPVPVADDLPADMRELPARQSQRIRHGTFRLDVTRLIEALEAHVHPTWIPPEEPAKKSGVSGRLTRILAGAVGPAILAAFPYYYSRAEEPHSLGEILQTYALAVFFVALLPVALLAAALHLAESLNRFERAVVVANPAALLLGQGMAMTFVLGLILGVVVAPYATGESLSFLISFVLVFMAMPIVGGYYLILEQAARQWPPAVPARGEAAGGRALRVMAQYRQRSASRSLPLSRLERDQTAWLHGRLEEAMEGLREETRRGWVNQIKSMDVFFILLISLQLPTVTLPALLLPWAFSRQGAGPVWILGGVVVAVVVPILGPMAWVLYVRIKRLRTDRIADEIDSFLRELETTLAAGHQSVAVGSHPLSIGDPP
ncbi:toll/interleukin-1 receptor domain-containing protein [Micromonospora sp. NPDC049107]|uniref:toll/interleukin-1 receptor domain-containing protein n=1 Tax=unclassified Micromonospora TaxID=2617518 RepID=UPI0033D70025